MAISIVAPEGAPQRARCATPAKPVLSEADQLAIVGEAEADHQDVIAVAATVAEQLQRTYDNNWRELPLYCSDLVQAAIDRMKAQCEQGTGNAATEFYSAAAAIAGAMAIMRAENPGSPGIAQLEQIHKLIDTAAVSLDFEMRPLEGMVAGIGARQVVHNNLVDLADEAQRAGMLVEWCIKAKATIDELNARAGWDEDFRELLKKKGIAYANVDWSACRMDEGLADVIAQQWITIRKMAGGEA
ncbi:hypothetical protein [Ottowia sp.]|uniref:hypothetical protein n=1 Tax=Ottowia sp. TaxID=1898956 RepID=UPI0039E49227